MYRWEIMAAVAAARVVAIVRERTEEVAARAVDVVVGAGLPVVEVTMTTPGALRIVARLRDSSTLLGLGTALSAGEVAAAAGAGARFVVTPNLSEDVIATAHRHGLAALVGCATPTEIVRALEAGADAVKLFPASTFGLEHLKALHNTLPWAPIVPTGGVTDANAADWIAAGGIAVGMGGGLTRGTEAEVRARVSALRAALTDARSYPLAAAR